jgi:hypothetical protein
VSHPGVCPLIVGPIRRFDGLNFLSVSFHLPLINVLECLNLALAWLEKLFQGLRFFLFFPVRTVRGPRLQ